MLATGNGPVPALIIEPIAAAATCREAPPTFTNRATAIDCLESAFEVTVADKIPDSHVAGYSRDDHNKHHHNQCCCK